MEELSELTKEISKDVREKGDYYNLLEKLADIQLGIFYVREICSIEKEGIHRAMKIKMDRLNEVLQDNGNVRHQNLVTVNEYQQEKQG